MIKYSKLKDKIIGDVSGIEKDDFYLLEGKLLFKSEEKTLLVKKYLETDFSTNVIIIDAVNYSHWNSTYKKELYFEELPFGIEI